MRHRHKPVRREKFVSTARAALLDVNQKTIRVKHDNPISDGPLDHRTPFGGYLGLNARTRSEIPYAVLYARHARRLLGQTLMCQADEAKCCYFGVDGAPVAQHTYG